MTYWNADDPTAAHRSAIVSIASVMPANADAYSDPGPASRRSSTADCITATAFCVSTSPWSASSSSLAENVASLGVDGINPVGMACSSSGHVSWSDRATAVSVEAGAAGVASPPLSEPPHPAANRMVHINADTVRLMLRTLARSALGRGWFGRIPVV